ncbi:MAG: rhodanese-like domain-containing protein [Gammaproteobacteria bacterium]|nr:sulfurtransferase [Pseudomonadales bacterium]MCP5346685.1 sulfurtransferase [Pseudomonadales bacterium]
MRIKAPFLALCAVLVPTLALGTPIGWQPLLEPQAVASILSTDPAVRVIRVSGSYGRGHLPDSIESPYEEWRGTGRNPGELRSLEEYTSLLQKLGIDATTPVVVVHEGANPADMGAATRVYWTLKTLGVQDVAVINGGFEAWEAAGLPVNNDPVSVTPSSYQPDWHDDWRVTTEQVESLVASGSGNLIDARPLSFYRGLRATLGEPGTIHGAANLEYESWFQGDSLKGRGELDGTLQQLSLSEPMTVSFCNTGHWASINWFVMSEVLGIDNTRLYAESVAAWSEADRPMDNQVGRLRVYTDLTLRWLRDLTGLQL